MSANLYFLGQRDYNFHQRTCGIHVHKISFPEESSIMNRKARKGFLATLLTLVMLITLIPSPVTQENVAKAATSNTGDLHYNTGHRDTVAESLSDAATAYYSDFAYDYAKIASGEVSVSGNDLKTALNSLMQTTLTNLVSYSSLPTYWAYSDAEDGKAGTIYFYSDVSNKEYSATLNREHVWPKSHGSFYENNGGTDLHHLRPAVDYVNSFRGNCAMGEIDNSTAETTKFGGRVVGYRKNGLFEPLSNVKGDVARIYLYVYLCWNQPNLFFDVASDKLPALENTSSSNKNDGYKVMDSIETLLKWNYEDPVDTWEMEQNDIIELVQGNRNVFIDYPEYAWLIFGEEVPEGIVSPASGNTVLGTYDPGDLSHLYTDAADQIDETELVPISEATEAQSGSIVTVQGQIEYLFGAGDSVDSAIIRDENGDTIQLYFLGKVFNYEVGDIIMLRGATAVYHGVTQIGGFVSKLVSKAEDNAPVAEPVEVSLAELNENTDNYVSQLVTVKNVVLGAYDSATKCIEITQASDDEAGTLSILETRALGATDTKSGEVTKLYLYQPASYPEGIARTDTVDIIGVATKRDDVAQIRVGKSEDFILVKKGEGFNFDLTTEEGILDAAFSLGEDENLGQNVSLTGTVSSIVTAYSSQYDNITVNLAVGGRTIQCFRLKGGETLNVNDEITVTGLIKNYKGTVEFDAGCTYVLVGGSTVTSTPTPVPTQGPELTTEEEILAAAFALGADESLGQAVTLTGEITSIKTAYNSQYNNVSVIIKVADKELLCYRLVGGSELKVGDVITVTGDIVNYKGNTVEFVEGSTYALGAVTPVPSQTVTPTTEPTQTTTPTQAPVDGVRYYVSPEEDATLDAAFALETGKALDGTYTLNGVVSEIVTPYDSGYGNITVTLKVGDRFIQCFRLVGGENLAVGDLISVTGKIKNYKGTVEFDAKCTYVLCTTEDRYEKIESAAQLTDGRYVLYGTSGEYAGALGNTVKSGFAGLVNIVPENGAFINPDAAAVWKIEKVTGENGEYFTLFNEAEGKYLVVNADKTAGFALADDATLGFTASALDTEDNIFLQTTMSNNSRGIAIYQKDFRAYKSANILTNKSALNLYAYAFTVLVPSEAPQPTVTPTEAPKNIFNKITTIEEIGEEGKFVLYGINGEYTGALGNTLKSGKVEAVAVAIGEDGTISTEDGNVIWTLKLVTEGEASFYTLYNEAASKYLVITKPEKASTADFALSDTPDFGYTVTVDEEGNFWFVTTSGTGRGIALYQSDFRTYANKNTLNLYKLAGATPVPTETPTPSPVPTEEAKGAFVQITTAEEIGEEGRFILYGINGEYKLALGNTYAKNNGQMAGVELTFNEDGTITTEDENIIWTLTHISGTDVDGNEISYYTLYNEAVAKYLVIKATGGVKSFELSDTPTFGYTASVDENGNFFLVSTSGSNRGISIYQADFRPYLANDAKVLNLYKYVEPEKPQNLVKGITQVTDAELADGEYVLFGINGENSGALGNTLKSGRANAVAVELTEGMIVDPSEDIIWKLEKVSSENAVYYTLFNEAVAKYLVINASKNTAAFELSDNAAYGYTVTVDENGSYVLATTSGTGRIITLYENDFRTYAASNAKTLNLYKFTAMVTPVPTVEPTATPTVTPTATNTPTPTATNTPTPTATNTPTPTATNTPTPTATNTPTPTATNTPTPTATNTPTPTATNTPTPTATNTPTPKPTATNTPTPRPTNIPRPTPGATYEEVVEYVAQEISNFLNWILKNIFGPFLSPRGYSNSRTYYYYNGNYYIYDPYSGRFTLLR